MKRILLLLFGFLLVINCSSGGGDDPVTPPVVTPPVTPPVVILQPGTPILSFPANNEPCEDGTSVNDSQSSVNFQWGTTANTQSYNLSITNLSTNVAQTIASTGASKVVVLSKSDPFKWKVTAEGAPGSTPGVSSDWKFYLAGNATVNYAPFPADLLYPTSGANVFSNVDNQIILSWGATDVDNDLSSYKVYIDTVDGSTLAETVSYVTATSTAAVTVTNGTQYFWKVVATDSNGNESDSGVYSFRVQ